MCNLQVVITASTVASDPCAGSGFIQVLSPIGTNYQYKIGNKPFQDQPVFLNVRAGQQMIVVKDANGCETAKEILIDTIAPGNRFGQVRHILANRCAGCHSGNNPQGGLDFTSVCDILYHWQRIDARAVQGIPSPMPQAGLIPLAERNKIIEWINAGHLYNN